MRLFVYGTLMDDKIRLKALGKDLPKTKAVLPGHVETTVTIGNEKYPSLVKAAPDRYVVGDIIDVHPYELDKADAWEHEHYDLQEVKTSAGPAWAYFLRHQHG